MINSRDINELLPVVRLKASALVEACRAAGIELLITSTYRDLESQAALYSKGRTAPGAIVTKALPGRSFHNWRVAFDVVPVEHGKANWDDAELWRRIGQIGESFGLEWAGRWKSMRELAHFQFTQGLTLDDLRAGRVPE